MKNGKKFKDTKFGQFLSKAAKKVPDAFEVVAAVKSGNPFEVIKEAKELFSKADDSDPIVKKLKDEFIDNQAEFMDDLQMYQLEVQDRASARTMHTENMKAGRTDFMYILTGTVIVLAFGLCTYTIIFVEIPGDNREMFTHLLGMVEGAFIGGMVNFFFGSSKGSKDKQAALDRLNKNS